MQGTQHLDVRYPVISGYLLATLDLVRTKCDTMLSVGGLSEGQARWVGQMMEDCERAKIFSKHAEDNFRPGVDDVTGFLRDFREGYEGERARARRGERIAEALGDGPVGEAE